MFYILFCLIYFILNIFRLSSNKVKWRGKDVKVWCFGGIIKWVKKTTIYEKNLFHNDLFGLGLLLPAKEKLEYWEEKEPKKKEKKILVI